MKQYLFLLLVLVGFSAQADLWDGPLHLLDNEVTVTGALAIQMYQSFNVEGSWTPGGFTEPIRIKSWDKGRTKMNCFAKPVNRSEDDLVWATCTLYWGSGDPLPVVMAGLENSQHEIVNVCKNDVWVDGDSYSFKCSKQSLEFSAK